MKVLVAGAGIGGLSAAIALQREGHEVKCYDRVREMRPIGAAISGECSVLDKAAYVIEQVLLAGAFNSCVEGLYLTPATSATLLNQQYGRTVSRPCNRLG
jgi:2-polyprenyl-6-methoxyphenol hydroxylase-like FAD-dependent oxidoreductase